MDIPAKSKSSDLGKRRQEEPRGVTQPKGKCPWGSLVPYTPSKTHFSKDDRDPVLRRIEDEGAIRLILKSTRSKKQNQLVKNATERLIATLEQTQHSDNLVLAEFTKPSNHILSRVSALYRDIEQECSDYKSTLTLVSGCMEDAIETAFEKLEVWNEDDEATAMRQDPAYTETNPSSSYDSTAPLSLKYPARSGHQSVPVRQGARDIVEFVTEEMQRSEDFGPLGDTWRKNEARRTLWKVFALTNTLIITGLIQGTLCHDCHTNPQVKEILDGMRKLVQATSKRKGQPCIYANIFADRSGNPMVVGDVWLVLERMECYAFKTAIPPSRQNLDIAVAIDNIQGELQTGKKTSSMALPQKPPQANGYRGYLFRSGDGAQFKLGIADHLRTFINNLRKRSRELDPLNENPHMPLTAPFYDVGYTRDVATRFRKHRKHDEKSHTTMNLFEATSQYLLGERYVMHQFVVYAIWEARQAADAEKAFSSIKNCSIKNGGGFEYHRAGESVNSIHGVTRAEWAEYARFALKHSPYSRNDRIEKERIPRLEGKRNWLLETIEEATDVLKRTTQQLGT